MKLLRNILCFLLAICSMQLVAWDDFAHVVVVYIAYLNMSDEVRDWLEAELKRGDQSCEGLSGICAASLWADHMKGAVGGTGNDRAENGQLKKRQGGCHLCDGWHFVTNPYDPEGILTDDGKKRIASREPKNLVTVLQDCIVNLNSPATDEYTRGWLLRNLLHLVADIHQPLHCATRFDSQFPLPAGDRGANAFKIQVPEGSLHQFWDSILGLGRLKPTCPLSLLEEEAMSAFALQVDSQPVDDALIDILDPVAWSQESFDLAVRYGYAGISTDQEPSAGYIAVGQQVALRQIQLAGRRLAKLVSQIYESNRVVAEPKKKVDITDGLHALVALVTAGGLARRSVT